MVTVAQAFAGDATVSPSEANDLLTQARTRAQSSGQNVQAELAAMIREHKESGGDQGIDDTGTARAILGNYGDSGTRSTDRLAIVMLPSSAAVPARTVDLATRRSAEQNIEANVTAARDELAEANRRLSMAAIQLANAPPTVTATIERISRAVSTEVSAGLTGSQRTSTPPTTTSTTPANTGTITVTNYPGVLPGAPDYLSENSTNAFRNRLETATTRVQVPNGLPMAPKIVAYRTALIDYMDAVRRYAQARAISGMQRTGQGIQALQQLGIVQATPQGVFTVQQAIDQINAEVTSLTTVAQGQSTVVDLAQGVVRAVVAAANTGLSATSPQDPLPSAPR